MNTDQLLAEVQNEIKRLEKIAKLLLGGSSSSRGTGKKRKLSRAARAKIAAAQKKRWAAVRAAKKQS